MFHENHHELAKEAHSKFDVLFETIGQLYHLHYGKETATDFDTIKKETCELGDNGLLSDYLAENLNRLLNAYTNIEKDHKNETEWFDGLFSDIRDVTSDLFEEIAELSDETRNREKKFLFRS